MAKGKIHIVPKTSGKRIWRINNPKAPKGFIKTDSMKETSKKTIYYFKKKKRK